MRDKYVLDSTVWVEIERSNVDVLTLVNPFIEKNEVCLVDLIAVELLRGTKTWKDYLKLREGFSVFTQLTTSWPKVGELAFQVSRKGFHPPLTDLYIAQCVIENKKTLITHDKHFKQIALVKSFELLLISHHNEQRH